MWREEGEGPRLTAPGPRSSFEATACVGDGHARTDTLQCSVIICSSGCHRQPRRTIRPPELADISLIFFSTPLYIYTSALRPPSSPPSPFDDPLILPCLPSSLLRSSPCPSRMQSHAP